MRNNPWSRIGLAAWSLGMEASSVIALRMLKLASGDKGSDAEARRMINEKLEASLDLQTKALTGALGITSLSATTKTLAYYRRKVRANRKRLAKV